MRHAEGRWIRALVLALVVVLTVAVGVSLAACTADDSTTPSDSANGDAGSDGGSLVGKALVETKCTECHDLARVTDASKSGRSEWETTVDRMVEHGLQVSDAEKTAILDHLETL